MIKDEWVTVIARDKRDGSMVQSCLIPAGMKLLFIVNHPELEVL